MIKYKISLSPLAMGIEHKPSNNSSA